MSTQRMAQGLRLRTRPEHPDFLDLPWSQPLDEWEGGRLVEVARGVHRHVVVFVDYDGALYALKELPSHLAQREFGLLRRLQMERIPVVEAVGVVERRGLDDVLITRFLDYSLPYRTVLLHQRRRGELDDRGLTERLLDALAMLLARLHLIGFAWGDCSLSNVLFRRDAGALTAYVVDVETGEWHEELTDGQRENDLAITEENVAGGLLDLQAELGLDTGPDPVELASEIRRRYGRIWSELTDVEEIGADERYKINRRVRRLNELGFDVDEIEFVGQGEDGRLRMRAVVAEPGHHARRLHSLTGLQAQENQARSLLNDLFNFKASRERRTGSSMPDQVAAHLWLSQVFEPVVEAIPPEHADKLEPVEVFHEIIEHKWFLSERVGRDVGVHEATADYFARVLVQAPSERRVLLADVGRDDDAADDAGDDAGDAAGGVPEAPDATAGAAEAPDPARA